MVYIQDMFERYEQEENPKHKELYREDLIAEYDKIYSEMESAEELQRAVDSCEDEIDALEDEISSLEAQVKELKKQLNEE